MKRRILSIAVVLVLVLTSMTSVAWAAPTTLKVGETNITGGGIWLNDGNGGITTQGASEETYNVKYNQASGELTLKGANITQYSNDGCIFTFGGNLTIILEGENTIKSGNYYGIYSIGGKLTIQGSGSLTAESTATTSLSYGIYVSDDDLIVEDGKVTGISNGGEFSYGVCTGSNLILENGSLTGINNNTATNSFGISVDNTLTIDNNSVISGQGKTAISASSYSLGNTSAWYGDNAQASFAAGPQSVPNDFTDINYAVIGTPYTLTTGDNITVSLAAVDNKYPSGMVLDITAQPLHGKVFESWSSDSGAFGNINALTTTFTMPAGNVTLTANYNDAPVDPGTSTTPASGKTETKSSTSPATGDDLNLGIYVVVMVLAGLAGTAVVWKRKKS